MAHVRPGLFDVVVRALEPSLRSVAPFVLTRLLLRAAIFDRDSLTASELNRALPILEAGLAEVLAPSELQAALNRIHVALQG